jgi:ABC-type dipeptide/oligopeptide/nickel transport system ATPase subunit
MEEENGTRIACVGHSGVGRATLTEALKTYSKTIEIHQLDEYDLAGLNLSDEQKNKLKEKGITIVELQPFIEFKDPFSELLKSVEEMEKQFKEYNKQLHTDNKKSKSWKKNRFFD